LNSQECALDAFAGLLHAHSALTRRLSAQLVDEHGLTISDYEVLIRLYRAPEQRLRGVDLAERVSLSASGITRLLDGLEKAGLVARVACPTDRRAVHAVLTDEGRARLERARESHVAQIEAALTEHLSRDELAQLAELLRKLGGDAGL
jgi:DNA-binding MarR family transcriptional regulator